VNQFFVIRGGAVGTKHVFAGSTRMVTKLAKQENPTIKSNNAGGGGKDKGPRERDMYFYHPDHLGSSSYVTDEGGRVFQHLEYFPFGETWVEEKSNTQRTPYLFTGKELDEDTGLYYFGARYYDQRTSVWVSVDPILGSYLPMENKEKNKNLRGMGGIFNSLNLALYHYSFLNPVRFIDPDGESGQITIYSNGDTRPSFRIDGHSWISYTPDSGKGAGVTTTYGTWGNNPYGLGNGLQRDLEQGFSAQVSRSMHIDDAAEQKLMSFIEKTDKKGDSAWTLDHPCSGFASDAWKVATGEILDANRGPFNDPSNLKESIIKANGGKPQGNISQKQKENSSKNFSTSLERFSGIVLIRPLESLLH